MAAAAVALGASGPASAPPGTTPEGVADSPTWWKSGNTKGSAEVTDRAERLTENLAVHHDLPCVYREVCIVEAPIKLFRSDRLISWIMIWRDILVRKRCGSIYTFSWIEDQHLLQKI